MYQEHLIVVGMFGENLLGNVKQKIEILRSSGLGDGRYGNCESPRVISQTQHLLLILWSLQLIQLMKLSIKLMTCGIKATVHEGEYKFHHWLRDQKSHGEEFFFLTFRNYGWRNYEYIMTYCELCELEKDDAQRLNSSIRSLERRLYYCRIVKVRNVGREAFFNKCYSNWGTLVRVIENQRLVFHQYEINHLKFEVHRPIHLHFQWRERESRCPRSEISATRA